MSEIRIPAIYEQEYVIDTPAGCLDLESNLPSIGQTADLRSHVRYTVAFLSFFSFMSNLLPRFIQPNGLGKYRKTSTSYLDALRGYAACAVVLYHSAAFEGLWYLDLPIVRVLYQGQAMVLVFFVISGYVLGYRMLQLMRKQDSTALLQALATCTFRRWLRLYPSTGVATFISMLFLRAGWTAQTQKKPTMFAQIQDWLFDFLRSSNPLADVKGWWYPGVSCTHYLSQMWTIPVEFKGSMIIFVFGVATCKLSAQHRMGLTGGCMVLFYMWQAVYAAMFLGGFLLAEMSLSRWRSRVCQSTLNLHWHEDHPQSLDASIAWSLLLLSSLFLLSQPFSLSVETPKPWSLLMLVVPSWWTTEQDGKSREQFWLGIGSLLLVLSLESCPVLQKPLHWRFSQYLGEISFGIYAMHYLLIWTFNDKIVILNHQDSASLWRLMLTIIPLYLGTFWLADYFTRIDRRIVKFGRWLTKTLFIDWS